MTITAATLKAKMRVLIHTLNTTDLVIEWNLSSVKWNAATNEGKLDIALIRDFMLDEFERRDPKAYKNWFEDDDPSDDPSRFYKSNEPSKFKPMTA